MNKSTALRLSKVENEVVFFDQETADWAASLQDRDWASVIRFMTCAELLEFLDSSHGGDMGRFFEIGFRAVDRRDRFIARFGHDDNCIVMRQRRGAR